MVRDEADFNEFSILEIKEVKSKKFKDSCCHSYLTIKGRCFTCPDDELGEMEEKGC